MDSRFVKPSLSVVIPVYNSQAILSELIESLGATLAELADRYEVVLVNDGSRDESWKEISRLASTRAWVRGINLMRNFGQHNALLCGIRAANGISPLLWTMTYNTRLARSASYCANSPRGTMLYMVCRRKGNTAFCEMPRPR